MTLLEDIQRAAVASDSDVASLLRQCRVLAGELRNRPLEDWVLWESNGYPDEVAVPNYRIWPLQVRGTFFGPFGSSYQNLAVPSPSIPDQYRERCTTFRCRMSIAAIETSLRERSVGEMKVGMGDLHLVLGMNVVQGFNCLETWGEFEAGHLHEAVNAVRNRILDFATTLRQEVPGVGSSGGVVTTLESSRITQIFNTTVVGGAAHVISSVGTSNIVVVGQRDANGLRSVLRQQRLADDDISELVEALSAEPVLPEAGGFGPRVGNWLGRMMEKAATGAWDTAVGAAGNLLSQVIAQYYGFPR